MSIDNIACKVREHHCYTWQGYDSITDVFRLLFIYVWTSSRFCLLGSEHQLNFRVEEWELSTTLPNTLTVHQTTSEVALWTGREGSWSIKIHTKSSSQHGIPARRKNAFNHSRPTFQRLETWKRFHSTKQSLICRFPHIHRPQFHAGTVSSRKSTATWGWGL